MTGSFPTTKVLNPDHLDHLRNEGFESDAAINWLISQGVRSITEEEARRLGLTYQGKAYAGILFPFTKEFLQVRADNPAVISIKNKRRVCKYISSHGQGVSRAWLPKDSGSGPLVITEGFKDAAAGTYFGEIRTGAIAGVSHWRTALLAQGIKPDVILYDADALKNHQVLQQLLQAGKTLGCKVGFVPSVTGTPKAGLGDWLKDQSDPRSAYCDLVEGAKRPEQLLEWLLNRMTEDHEQPSRSFLKGLIRIGLLVFGSQITKEIELHCVRERWLLREEVKDIRRELAMRQYRAKYNPRLYSPPAEMPALFVLDRMVPAKNLVLYGEVWWKWNERYWEPMSSMSVTKEVQTLLFKAWRVTDRAGLHRPFTANSHVEDAYRSLKIKTFQEQLRSHAIAFKNGTLYPYLRHFKKDFTKEDYCLRNIDHDYLVGDYECPPVLHQFLLSSYGEDIIPIIQAVIWMLLNPMAPYSKFVWLIGDSGSGKGVLLNFLSKLYPERSVAMLDGPASLATAEKRHQNLSGKSLCIFPDVRGVLKELDAFYGLVENDPLSGRALYSSNAYSIEWGCRFLMASVSVLQTDHGNDGLRRRALVIPTKGSLDGEPDPDLKAKLEQCIPQAIAWGMSINPELAIAVLSNPSEFSDRIEAATHNVAATIDSLGAFVDSCLVYDPQARTSVNTLFRCFKAYCKTSGHSPMNIKNFGVRLKGMLGSANDNRFYEGTKQVRGYIGIRPVSDLFIRSTASNAGPDDLVCLTDLLQEGNLETIKRAFGVRF